MLVLPTDPQEARFALSDFAESNHPPLRILQELANVLVNGPVYVTASAGILLRQRCRRSMLSTRAIDVASPENCEAVSTVLRSHLHRFVWPVPADLSQDEARRTCEVFLVRAACGDDVANELCEMAITTGFGTAQNAIHQLKHFFPKEVSIPRLKQVFTVTTNRGIRFFAGLYLVRLGDRTSIPYFEDDLQQTTTMPNRLLKALGLSAAGSDFGTTTAVEIIETLSDAEHRDDGLKTVEHVLTLFPQAPQSFHEVADRLRTKVIDGE